MVRHMLEQEEGRPMKLAVGGSREDLLSRLEHSALTDLIATIPTTKGDTGVDTGVVEVTGSIGSNEGVGSRRGGVGQGVRAMRDPRPKGANGVKGKGEGKRGVREEGRGTEVILSDSEGDNDDDDDDDKEEEEEDEGDEEEEDSESDISLPQRKRAAGGRRKAPPPPTGEGGEGMAGSDTGTYEGGSSGDSNPRPRDVIAHVLNNTFGHIGFRTGQRWAIERCVAGHRSLLVLPTGAGKSLCYMLPALLSDGLTIVVSPLISLMRDQLRKLPLEVPGACLSGGLTAHEATRISTAVLRGHVKVLFVSPERLCTPSFRNLINMIQRTRSEPHHLVGTTNTNRNHNGQSAVSLLCIDEAHCLSQWSYNFRPSFLRIRREVAHIRPAAILALTATANSHIQRDVMQHLSIEGSTYGRLLH